MGNVNPNIIAIVSLVIAIIAFVVASAQALQQFAASAEGYNRCKEGIMGLWGKKTRRRFSFDEFRFKVWFHSPVVFVAPPENRYGPVYSEVYSILGTSDSYAATHCRDDKAIRAKKETLKQSSGNRFRVMNVHTADDELASWVGLLESLQRAEKEGREWEIEQSKISGKSEQAWPVNSKLVVQLQERRRDFGEMPDAVQKPFATSTISHICEIAVMLGMVWRTFDQDAWNLRAEGNGYILLSQPVLGLGISLSFQVTGKSKFQANRPIPCEGLRELIFGTVPTRIPNFEMAFEPWQEDWSQLQITQRTLRGLGCARADIKRYFTRRHHIRSVNFEIIAMAGDVLRTRGSHFTRIPNPTPDPWVSSLSACVLMTEFQNRLEALALKTVATSQMEWIRNTWNGDLQHVWQNRDVDINLNMREVVHDVLDRCDNYLKTFQETTVVREVIGAHLIVVLAEINDPNAFLNSVECDTEEELIEQYFDCVREKVIDTASSWENNIARRMSVMAQSNPQTPQTPRWVSIKSKNQASVLQDIWLTLMFRMCCWWLLHEFDETDIMILPPRLKASRLPVYIL